jgi:hypothetical protein
MIDFRPMTNEERMGFEGAGAEALITEVSMAGEEFSPSATLIWSAAGLELIVIDADGESIASYTHALVPNVDRLLVQPITRDQLASWEQII